MRVAAPEAPARLAEPLALREAEGALLGAHRREPPAQGRRGPTGDGVVSRPLRSPVMTEPAPTTRPQRERPLGVVLIAAFLALDALLVVAERFLGLDIGSRAQLIDDPEGRLEILIVVLVLLRLVAAVGLWFGLRRAWVLAMLLVGFSLVLDLWLYWNGQRSTRAWPSTSSSPSTSTRARCGSSSSPRPRAGTTALPDAEPTGH